MNKLQEQKELIKDLTAIMLACNNTLKLCDNIRDRALLRRELVITYEERERQYTKLDNMLHE